MKEKRKEKREEKMRVTTADMTVALGLRTDLFNRYIKLMYEHRFYF